MPAGSKKKHKFPSFTETTKRSMLMQSNGITKTLIACTKPIIQVRADKVPEAG